MKKVWFLIPLLASCGLFKEKPAKAPIRTLVFNHVDFPAIRSALVLDYIHSEKGEDFNLGYYPLTDSGYSFEFTFADIQGTVNTPDALKASGNQYAVFNENDLNMMDGRLVGWLSQRNFREIQLTGKTVLGFGKDTAITFEFKGVSDYTVVLADTNYRLKVVEMVGVEKPYYFSFIPDAQYPLLVKIDVGYTQTLINVLNKETPYSDFEPGPGCVLQYRMIEAGVNEYEIKLQNIKWTEEELKFNMSGTFASEGYSYNFEYDVIYTGKSLKDPEFMTPIFSAIKGEKMEEKNNWIFLRKNEISEIEKSKSARLSVPHFAEDPREIPDAYEDTASFNEALREFEQSNHTQFNLSSLGRLKHTDYMYFDKSWGDNLLLGGLRLINEDLAMEIIVHNKGPFPLLLYFNDGQMYEIFLEAAGKAEE